MLDSSADVKGVLSVGIEPRGLECPWYLSQGSQAIHPLKDEILSCLGTMLLGERTGNKNPCFLNVLQLLFPLSRTTLVPTDPGAE